jgi:catalase
MPSVVFDAVYVPGGKAGAKALAASGDARHFVGEAYKHAKPIAVSGDGADLLRAAGLGAVLAANDPADGIFTIEAGAGNGAAAFVAALAQHRVWERSGKEAVPA